MYFLNKILLHLNFFIYYVTCVTDCSTSSLHETGSCPWTGKTAGWSGNGQRAMTAEGVASQKCWRCIQGPEVPGKQHRYEQSNCQPTICIVKSKCIFANIILVSHDELLQSYKPKCCIKQDDSGV